MVIGNSFKLEKLKIHVYKTTRRSISDKIETLEVMFNPNTYSQRYGNEFSKLQGLNTSSTEVAYLYTPPQELALELILDGTNSYASSTSSQTVKDRVEKFIMLTISMNGEIHQPPFLKIEWGNLIFDCRLGSLNVTYNLFNRAGQPLRAKLDTVFIADINHEKQANLVKKSSPDLTHIRTVTSGDNLPLMAHKVYRDPALYLQIAAANNLDSFRGLNSGIDLFFFPLKEE